MSTAGADCSERTCPFGKAHVDSPKGDLDMSGDNLATSTVISGSSVYPYGTEELFPLMADTDGNVLSDTAHYYMECSNKVGAIPLKKLALRGRTMHACRPTYMHAYTYAQSPTHEVAQLMTSANDPDLTSKLCGAKKPQPMA
jgi:hypothetical protein